MTAPWPYGPGQQPAPPTRPAGRRHGGAVKAGVAAVSLVAAAGVGFAAGTTRADHIAGTGQIGDSGSGSSVDNPFGNLPVPNGGGQNGSGQNGGLPGGLPGGGQNGGVPGGGSGSGQSASLPTASARQQTGVVDINTVLRYQGAKAAGTGMVLTGDGLVLTNNHVVDGATSITGTVTTTGRTYRATLVGTVPTEDVAVLKLTDAAGLTTARFGGGTSLGAAVTGVGNAQGAGGAATAATGRVTEVHAHITASDEGGQNPETLSDVIATNAPIQPGDSGGPLYDGQDRVVGMDTAASATGANARSRGFAIPIAKVLSLAKEVRSGVETSTVHIGYPAFLGVEVGQSTGPAGVAVAGLLPGGPAAAAGLATGDVITRVGDTTVTSPTQLQRATATDEPGDRTTVSYTDAAGAAHTVTVVLATGPAD